MRFSTLATSLAATSVASARIVGIAAPSTLAPGSTFTLTIFTQNFIQTVADVAVAYGFQVPTAQRPRGIPGTLGAFTGSAYLGPSKSNTIETITVEAKVSEALRDDFWFGKDVILTAGVYSLLGASGGPSVVGYNVTVKIGAETGGDLVRSQEAGWDISSIC